MDIPFDLLYMVASYIVKPRMKLLDWIPEYKLSWDWLSYNPNALHLLEKYPEKINWKSLSSNPNAIHLLEKYPDKIHWENLSNNPDALHMLKNNPNKICWDWLSTNPSIFEIDTEQTYTDIKKKANEIDF